MCSTHFCTFLCVALHDYKAFCTGKRFFAYRKIRKVLTGVLARVVARYIGILVKVTFKIQPL